MQAMQYILPPPDEDYEVATIEPEFVGVDADLMAIYRENWHNIRTIVGLSQLDLPRVPKAISASCGRIFTIFFCSTRNCLLSSENLVSTL